MKKLFSRHCQIVSTDGDVQCTTPHCPKITGNKSVFDEDCFIKPHEVSIRVGCGTYKISTMKTDAELQDIIRQTLSSTCTFLSYKVENYVI